MTERKSRKRLHSHITRSRFLHLEDALDIGKVRLFAGGYRKGNGASSTAFHFLDLDDARVLFADLSWGKAVDFADFKGTSNSSGPQSRVLKIKSKEDKVWFEVQNGPGEIIGQGAVKPKGKPTAAVSIPLSTWEARKLAHAALAYIRAWETRHLLDAAPTGPLSPPPCERGGLRGGDGDTALDDQHNTRHHLDGDSKSPVRSGSPAPPVTTPSPVVTEVAHQVGAPVTTAPEVFAGPGEAIAWGFQAGAFKARQHAASAYEKLKQEKKPASAQAMAALWAEDVQRRLVAA